MAWRIALLLAALGVAVTIIGRRGWVMPRMLDPETAAIAGAAMEARGVKLRLGVEAIGFVEVDGVASGVRMDDGELVTADLYVAATGVKPNVGFLARTGVQHQWGITGDRQLRERAGAPGPVRLARRSSWAPLALPSSRVRPAKCHLGLDNRMTSRHGRARTSN